MDHKDKFPARMYQDYAALSLDLLKQKFTAKEWDSDPQLRSAFRIIEHYIYLKTEQLDKNE